MSTVTVDNVAINTNAVTHNTNGNETLSINPSEAADIAANVCSAMSEVSAIQAVIASKPTV